MKYLYPLFICLLLFYPLEKAQTAEEIYGLLVEGTDYSGKSSVCESIKPILLNEFIDIEMNHCYISRHPVVLFLWEKAKKKRDILQGSWYHAAAALIDLKMFKPKPGVFYLQDRNWLSHDCRMKFLHPDLFGIPTDYFPNKHRPFKWNVYLTASPEVKMERYMTRKKKSSLNQFFMENIEFLIQYDSFCISQIPPSENWIIIDTSNLTIDEVVEKILDFINGNQAEIAA